MGNPDLVIIINKLAYLIIGTTYKIRDDAILMAIEKHRKGKNMKIEMIKNSTQEQLMKDKDDFIQEIEQEKEIKTIEIYEL